MSSNANGPGHPEPARDGEDRAAEPSRSPRSAPPNRTPEGILADLAATIGEFQRLLNGRKLDDLAQPAQDGGWGIVEILPHMRDWELIYRDRLPMALEHDEPTLEEYDDSLWAIEHAYSEQDPETTWDEFRALREALVARLTAMSPDDWQRVVILPKQGRVTLQWLMNNLTAHDAKHLVQARDVLA